MFRQLRERLRIRRKNLTIMIQKARRNAIHRRSSRRENVRDVISNFLSIAQGNVCINSVAFIIGANYSTEGPTARWIVNIEHVIEAWNFLSVVRQEYTCRSV